jgi:peptide/nickel transport system substrate-binding protein
MSPKDHLRADKYGHMLGSGTEGLEMMRISRLVAASALVLVAASSCTGRGHARFTSARLPDVPTGGTLVVGIVEPPSLDPQLDYSSYWEVLQCCLVRTLLYTGATTVTREATPVPDLAVSLPKISRDGLSWTFHLKRGIHYAPPLTEVEVEAQDFVRALERLALIPDAWEAGYAPHYSIVEGFDQFADGRADSISGLEVRGKHTFVVHTTEAVGYVPDIFSLPAASPLPPNPAKPESDFGVAQGHDEDYGHYVVSSGPYMFEGSEHLDFSMPPAQQASAVGRSEKAIVLVRNPSWEPESDPLRPAYLDRIELIGGSTPSHRAALKAGELDLVWDTPNSAAQVERFKRDPDLRDRIMSLSPNEIFYVPLNLALPPFDDIHVRRALNYVVNKRRLARWAPGGASPHGHIAPDLIGGNLLLDYDPHHSTDDRGDLAAAKKEMSQSAYDEDGDGVCDHRACKIQGITFETSQLDVPRVAHSIARDFRQLGIEVRVKKVDIDDFFAELGGPTRKLGLAPGWVPDFPSWGQGFFPPLFTGSLVATGCCNNSMVGASPRQLRSMGYPTTRVPSVDAKLEECARQVGDLQARCWAEFDVLLMEEIVPWIPLLTFRHDHILSERVVNYAQRAGLPALDHFAIRD